MKFKANLFVVFFGFLMSCHFVGALPRQDSTSNRNIDLGVQEVGPGSIRESNLNLVEDESHLANLSDQYGAYLLKEALRKRIENALRDETNGTK